MNFACSTKLLRRFKIKIEQTLATKPFSYYSLLTLSTMKNVGIYLTFEGNCADAFDYYKSVFGGEFGWKGTYGNSPLAKDTPVDQHDRIMHVSLTIGNKFDLMGSDRSPMMDKEASIVGTNTQISLTPDSKDEADRLFQVLSSDGGKAEMPMDDQFWGSYFGACTDKFGIRWMIDCPSGSSESVMKSEMKLAAKALREAADLTSKQADLLEKLSKEDNENADSEDGDAATKERHTKKIKIDEYKDHRMSSDTT